MQYLSALHKQDSLTNFGEMTTRSEREKAQKLNEQHQAILTKLLREDDNKYCADCKAKGKSDRSTPPRQKCVCVEGQKLCGNLAANRMLKLATYCNVRYRGVTCVWLC